MDDQEQLLQKIVDMVNNKMDLTTEKYAVSKYKEWSGLISKVETGIQKVVSDVGVLRNDVNELKKLVDPIQEIKHKVDVEFPIKYERQDNQISNLTSDSKTAKSIAAWFAGVIGLIIVGAIFKLIII